MSEQISKEDSGHLVLEAVLEQDELRQFSKSSKDIRTEIDNLFRHRFRELSVLNADEFDGSVKTILRQVRNFISEHELAIEGHLAELEHQVELAEKYEVPKSDPYLAALEASTAAMKRLAIASQYKSQEIDILTREVERLMPLFEQVKDVQAEKMKVDATKELTDTFIRKYDDLLGKSEERAAKLMARLEAELERAREHNLRLSAQVLQYNSGMRVAPADNPGEVQPREGAHRAMSCLKCGADFTNPDVFEAHRRSHEVV